MCIGVKYHKLVTLVLYELKLRIYNHNICLIHQVNITQPTLSLMVSYSIQLTYHTVQYCMMKNHSNQVDDTLHPLHHIQSMYSYHICYPTVHHTILVHDQLCYTVMCYHSSVAVLLQHYLVLYKNFHVFKIINTIVINY